MAFDKESLSYFWQQIIARLDNKIEASALSAVAISGDYNDLNNKPIIPSVEGLATEDYVNTKFSQVKYPVTSVNGKTGAVSLAAADVSARPNNWTPTASQVGAIPKVSGASEAHIPVFKTDGTLVSSGVNIWGFTRATYSLQGGTLYINTQ